jgi:hypothetical protein
LFSLNNFARPSSVMSRLMLCAATELQQNGSTTFSFRSMGKSGSAARWQGACRSAIGGGPEQWTVRPS